VHFLRGMEDALMDMASGAPEMDEIVELILNYNLAYLRQALQLGSPVDVVSFGDDWGAQDRCLITRQLSDATSSQVTPKCMPFAGSMAPDHQHSDGYTVDLWDEFLEAGLVGFNMQVNSVGIDAIERRLKGKMCIIADVDRQKMVPFGTPLKCALTSPRLSPASVLPGRLVLRIDIYPDVPCPISKRSGSRR